MGFNATVCTLTNSSKPYFAHLSASVKETPDGTNETTVLSRWALLTRSSELRHIRNVLLTMQTFQCKVRIYQEKLDRTCEYRLFRLLPSADESSVHLDTADSRPTPESFTPPNGSAGSDLRSVAMSIV